MRTLATLILFLIPGVAGAGVCPIPLEPTRTSFVTKVWIEERGPFRFLVDTGTSVTVVTPSVGLHPSKTIEALTTSGPVEVAETIAPSLRAGDIEVADLRVLVADLPRFPSHGRVDGILGMNFLEGRSARFDVRRRCLAVDVLSEGGLAAEVHGGRVTLVSDGLRYVLDSAASFPVLMSSRAQKLAVEDGSFEMTTAGGKQTSRVGTIGSLRLGPVTLRNVRAAMVDGHDPAEDVLLPITLFESVWISADRSRVELR